MATKVLYTNVPIHRKPRDDIESIFYVLLYVCMKLDGPETWRSKSCTIDQWFATNPSFAKLALVKVGFMEHFASILRRDLSPYFSNFSHLFKNLYSEPTMGSPYGKARHAPTIDILDTFYMYLPETETPGPDLVLGL